MSFGDISTTTATSEMEPSQILFDGLQLFALADRGVTGGFFLSVAGVLDRHPDFIIYLMVWLLYYIIFWLHLCWAEEGPKCNVMLTIIFFLSFFFLIIFKVERICWTEQGLKCNVMPTIIFFLFLRLNGSVHGLKPRIYYYYY